MYQVIARAWRPQKFSEVIGQRHVTQTLQNAIRLNRIGHGYIFSGQRGTGKTTVARLLAKALNCHKGPAPEPCGECDSCKEIAAGRAVDVIEIDAASNRGIDAVRELRENARYAPARDRFKVFIIDEAHQITTEGFNALLKTLEEPPSHVVFLLATTEVHQFPETILSRCQHFALHTLTFAEILNQLQKVCDGEKVQADAEALAILAKSGQGSLRDAQSRLEQAISAFGEKLEGPAVRRFLGEAPVELVEGVFQAVIERRRERMLEIVEQLVEDGNQLNHFCSELIQTVRNLLVVRVAGPDRGLIDGSPEEIQRLKVLSEGFTDESLMRYLEILLQLHQQLRFSMEPRFQMELGLLKLIEAERLVAIEDLLAGMESGVVPKPVPERPVPVAPAARPAATPAAKSAQPTPWELDQMRKRQAQEPAAEPAAVSPSATTSPAAAPANSAGSAIVPDIETEVAGLEELWIQEILNQLDGQSKHMLASMLSQAKAWEFSESELIIRLGEEGLVKLFAEKDRQLLEQISAAILGRKVKVSLTVASSKTKAAPETPSKRRGAAPHDAGNPNNSASENRVRQDPQVQEFEKLFGKKVTVIRDWKE